MSAVHWVCKKIFLKSASEQLSAATISRQHRQLPASLTHAQTLPLAVRHKDNRTSQLCACVESYGEGYSLKVIV